MGQAQVKLEVIVYIGVKVEADIVVKVGIQLLAQKLKSELELSLAIRISKYKDIEIQKYEKYEKLKITKNMNILD